MSTEEKKKSKKPNALTARERFYSGASVFSDCEACGFLFE